jgi:hypothetical protein
MALLSLLLLIFFLLFFKIFQLKVSPGNPKIKSKFEIHPTADIL